MSTFKLGAALGSVLLFSGLTSVGCVADRPARNGVFNENQYVRKDFLIQGADTNGSTTSAGDPGWFVKATVLETSTPNLLGGGLNGVFPGSTNLDLVRFRVTQDKLQLIDQYQISNPVNPDGTSNTTGVTASVINAWGATNVDLKYRVNLDGETTNFYEENQELDWQVRQWVKLQFDKNDFSDLAPLGPSVTDLINQCADVGSASATLVTGSFIIDQGDPTTIADDYMEFTVQLALPMKFDNATCNTAYGNALNLAGQTPGGRFTETINLKYSFQRASTPTYKAFPIAEKDPIRAKYGPILTTVFNYDPNTQLLAANQYVTRNDPTKPIVWYFDKNFPQNYKCIFRDDGSPLCATFYANYGKKNIQDATNALLATAAKANPNVKAQLSFKDYNDGGITRSFGDVRYKFLSFTADLTSVSSGLLGATWPLPDLRTGEILNQHINFFEYPIDEETARIDAYLASIGDDSTVFAPMTCSPGQTLPIVDATNTSLHNANSTLFKKMQGYLGYPAVPSLGPQDFLATHNQDFLNAYFAIAPYELFADPASNPFVTPEGGSGTFGAPTSSNVWDALTAETQFQQMAATINSGAQPFVDPGGTAGVANAAAFVNQMRTLQDAHTKFEPTMRAVNQARGAQLDTIDAFSFERMMQRQARHCTAAGVYQTKAEWEQGVIDTFYQQTMWHEFGHSMGLDHNFMGSVDAPNFTPATDANGKPLVDADGVPQYQMYSSTVMEYQSQPNDYYWTAGWGSWDQAAITWMYANDGVQADNPAKDTTIATNKPRSGQADATYPYLDPNGFNGATEINFLRCDATHIQYSPLCRQFDAGTTPSEIVANAIDDYEWQFQFRNFRKYHKVWNLSNYANAVVNTIVDMRRFYSQWAFDWSPGEIAAVLHRIGIVPPASANSAQDYYTQLTNNFEKEMSLTNQMVAAFSEAVIQQASDERPYATVFDPLYGDETQQGIILDKFFAMQNFVGLWQATNYDPTQATGAYLSSWGSFDYEDSYQSVAETTVTSMIGSQYAVYPYFIPTAVALFAQDTHSPTWLSGGGRIEAKDWIGGWTFTREQDLIDYFKNIAVQNAFVPNVAGATACTAIATCAYDPTDPSQVSQAPNDAHFTGPDGLVYVYAYLPSRAVWVLARQDRNIVTWKNIIQYNSDLLVNHDDGTISGTNAIYGFEYQIKYTIDAYNAYELGAAN